ncbi:MULTISPECIES: LTA synthase family protein [unclassified Burkholderia]|uniref:LTA synthase family protein n=1 Tax=unclassified Burkholderia TaxID=2613784 RepID=UPI000F582FA0|nr:MULTISPECIES: LTA synthase family protein [unclassified Burkholderia]RQR39207.1 LTA synthase family protein [Burkholderia sp. Bp9142]RQR51899.1 LTA synthase family protein [Burkholderia sp. Bp9140]
MSGTLVLVFAMALAASFGLDAVAVPRAPLRRPLRAVLLHALAVSFVGACVLAVTARPVFSAGIAAALVALVAVISNAKFESLREPFVFTDLSLFSQLFAHPRLYLPFLSVGKVVAIAAGVALLVAGCLLDHADAPPRAVAAAAALVCLLIGARVAARLPLTLEAAADQHRLGFFAVFVAYLLNGLRPATLKMFDAAVAMSQFASGSPSRRPDVIVIQSESFFDIRRATSAVAPSLLSAFDRARREAIAHGKLTVPAWGANTMRTEFAVLTGMAADRLGYARFYPYAFLRKVCPSLAGWFRRGGYRTLAVHPYHADFFGRDRVFPLMHFDAFMDIRSFDGRPRVGQYVADAAVADAIIDVLDAPREHPAFIFAMTMENHGPLHLEAVAAGEAARYHSLGDDDAWHDLTAYLRHLDNANRMIERLLDHLRQSDRETIVCFYGDHVPALRCVFDQLGVLPDRSDYFVWKNDASADGSAQDIRAEELGRMLTSAVTHSNESRARDRDALAKAERA